MDTYPAPGKAGHPEASFDTNVVAYDDNRFCASRISEVVVMASAHRHSQFELNFILEGSMTYWFDGREIVLPQGCLALFWGLVPHRSIACTPGTRFVCFYVPIPVFMAYSLGEKLRRALFSGAMAAAVKIMPWEAQVLQSWREDLIAGDARTGLIVRDELGNRLRRMEQEGWHEMQDSSAAMVRPTQADTKRAGALEAMLRFIGEKADTDISASDIATAAGLHPNYAMAIFKRTFGETIGTYLTRYRLDTAQALLISTDDDITGIAFSAGFNSLSSFYEVFRRRFHTSPVKFRRMHRG